METGYPTATGATSSSMNAPAQSPSSATAVAGTSKNGFNFYINGFRGFCVLLVFAYHVVNSGLIPVPATPTPGKDAFLFFASSWRYGVELFFMISGFVIINSLRRHNSISTFLMDRCIRIFPVWVPVHLCIFFLGIALGWKYFASTAFTDKFSVFVANLFLLPPLVPIPVLHPASWSLTYEWLFYLVVAAVCASFARRGNEPARVAALLFLSMMVICLLMLMPRALFFIPGVIIALNWQAIRNSSFMKLRMLRMPLLSLVLFLIAWRAVNLDEAKPTITAIGQVLSWPGLAWALLAFFAGLSLFACVCDGVGLAQRLRNPAMQVLGNVSYSFYLWHPIVMFAVKKPVIQWLLPHAGWFLSIIVFAVMSFALALLVSNTSYQWIEKKLAKRLRAMISARDDSQHDTSPVAIALGHEGRS